MNKYIIDIEDMPDLVRANSLKEAVKKAHLYLGVRKMQKDEEETWKDATEGTL